MQHPTSGAGCSSQSLCSSMQAHRAGAICCERQGQAQQPSRCAEEKRGRAGAGAGTCGPGDSSTAAGRGCLSGNHSHSIHSHSTCGGGGSSSRMGGGLVCLHNHAFRACAPAGNTGEGGMDAGWWGLCTPSRPSCVFGLGAQADEQLGRSTLGTPSCLVSLEGLCMAWVQRMQGHGGALYGMARETFHLSPT